VDFQSAFELQDIVAKEVIAGMNVQFTQKEILNQAEVKHLDFKKRVLDES